jgi:hypothetical protein
MVSLNGAEAKKYGSEPQGSVVEESWGVLRLDPRQVRKILSEEDGLFDA